MSKCYEIVIPAHNSIYVEGYLENNYEDRKITVKYAIPDKTNHETGIVLLIAGYGANSSSKVYAKMRREFADMYNLVIVQCDYMGWKFMQTLGNEKDIYELLDRRKDVRKSPDGIYILKEQLCENLNDFNDMGLMQAVDNITAVLFVEELLQEYNIPFCKGKVIAYGQSHGAYLAYYCNRIKRDLFSLIIDNSSYVYPVYLDSSRMVYFSLKDNSSILNVCIEYEYLIEEIEDIHVVYDLKEMYNGFENYCTILSFHGTNDNMSTFDEKKEYVDGIKGATIYRISEEDLKDSCFKSSKHGLGADFLELFNYAYNIYMNMSTVKKEVKREVLKEQFITKNKRVVEVNYEEIFPCIFID